MLVWERRASSAILRGPVSGVEEASGWEGNPPLLRVGVRKGEPSGWCISRASIEGL